MEAVSRARVRALALALAALACAAGGVAAADGSANPPLAGENVATTDDARALRVNPAALGAREPAELRFEWVRHDGRRDGTRVLASAGGFGAFADHDPDGTRAFGLALAAGDDRLRLGWSPRWLSRAGEATTADHRFGLLARPVPWLSAGATVDHAREPRWRGARLPRTWTVGLGLRPLALDRARAHDAGTRFTLGAELELDEDAPRFGGQARFMAELEPVPGLVLHGTAARGGHVRLGVTLRGVRASLHGGLARRDGHAQRIAGALSVHAGEERTVFAAPAQHRVAVVRAGGLLADESLGGASLLGASGTTSSAPLRRQLVRALEDPLVRGVLLELRGVGGMAQLEELRPRVQLLRLAGKPVVAYLEYGGGRGDLYLASACDRVFATEEAAFRGLGLRAERRYYRELLERLGVRLDRASIGEYKSAYRNYSVDSTTAADAEVIGATLDQSQALFVEALSQGRGVPPERFANVLDGRAWSTADLVAAGLVDSAGYREQALAELGRLAGLGAKPGTVDLRRVTAARREWTRPAPVAVVYASGGIERGRSGNDLLTGPYLGSETLVGQLERAFRAPGIRAVVLRVESPGGDAIASNLIDHAVQRLKRETGKPLVVSMGSMAASGGYYIASHADRIFADRHTRTGSIGVLFVKPSLEGFYAKHGVRQDVFERGAFMGGTSLGRDWTPGFQASADSAVGRHYDLFVSKVAGGRGLSPVEVERVARGRVWLGDDAVRHRLVDEIGGLEAALEEARERAGVVPGERIRLFELRRPRGGFLERLVHGWVSETLEREASLRSLQGPQLRDPEWLEGLWE